MSLVKELSFYNLIEKNIIEIPIIQREYAQGRQIQKILDIRQDFVEDLILHIKENKKLHLGFVYGRTDGDNKKLIQKNKEVIENILGSVKSYANQFHFDLKTSLKNPEGFENSETKFIPLDGQQRLTTLYLLFWLIYLKNDSEENADWLNNFFYLNRKSAKDFIEAISKVENIKEIRKNLNSKKDLKLSDVIENMKFFLIKWKNNSTVRGMLVMLDDLYANILELDVDCKNLDLKDLPIFFDYLDLNELDQSDELYVKMNARGKQLTDFEHFKAWLQEQLKNSNDKEQDVDKKANDKIWLEKFWIKIDTDWLNYFWREFDDDFSKLDDYYYNFIKHLGLIFNLENTSLYSKIRNTNLEKIEYISLKNYLLPNEQLFFNIDCLRFVEKVFTFLLDDEKKKLCNSLLSEIYCAPFTNKGNAITDKFLKKEESIPSLWDVIYYKSFLQFVTEEEVFDEIEFKNWMRLTRNLIYNTQIQTPGNFYDALNQLNYLKIQSKNNVYHSIFEPNFVLKFWDKNQFDEEKIKIPLLEKKGFSEILLLLENHEYFYGQINFLLEFSKNSNGEFDSDKFKFYADRASIIYSDSIRNFSERIPQFLIQRALLTYGDYFLKKDNESNFKFCLNISGTLRTKNENWRLLFDNATKRNYLKQLLDEIINISTEEIRVFLKHRISDFLIKESSKDWKFFFVKYPEVFNYCDEGAIRWFDEFNIRLLKGTAIVGYHCELRGYSFYVENRGKDIEIISNRIALNNFQPFKKFFFLDDRNTAGHPGFQLYHFEINDGKYKIEVRYKLNVDDNFEVKFIEYSDIQKTYNISIITILKEYGFEEIIKEDKLYFCKEVSSKELKKSLEEICSRLSKLESNATD
jgi:hypothetical protein